MNEVLEHATCPVCYHRVPVMYHFRDVVGIAVHFNGESFCPQREAVAALTRPVEGTAE